MQKNTDEDGAVGEKIFMLLDSVDGNKKIKILSNIFRAAVLEQITWDEYWRFNIVVKNSTLEDLNFLKNNSNESLLEGLTAQNLYINGVASIKWIGYRSGFSERMAYSINEIGKKLAKYI